MRVSFALAAFFLPLATKAQDAAEAMAGTPWDVLGWILVAGAGGLVVSGLGWLMGWGVSKLRKSKSPEMVKNMVAGFVDALRVGLSGTVGVLEAEFEKARAPDSPGGVKITQEELGKIGEALKQFLLKQYGSWDGIAKVVSHITGGAATKEAAEGFIDNFVAANAKKAIKAGEASVDPSTPAR